MRANYRLQRLFVPDDLQAGAELEPAQQQAHYLLHVLRVSEGTEILLFNGRDGEWSATVAARGKKTVRLAVDRMQRPQPPLPDLVYCFAPLKQGRLDYLVQKAVEMGAGILQPVLTQHTQVARPGIDRLRANIVEAAEQCGVLAVPLLRDVQRLDSLLAGWDRDRRLIFCDEAAETDNPIPVLEAVAEKKVGLLVGPEGGIAPEEIAAFTDAGAVPVRLGPTVLRTSTAAAVALGLIKASPTIQTPTGAMMATTEVGKRLGRMAKPSALSASRASAITVSRSVCMRLAR